MTDRVESREGGRALDLLNDAAFGEEWERLRSECPWATVFQSRAFAEDAMDLCYVKDCARAFSMLQLAPKLNHTAYNVGMGRAVKNRELVAALKKVIPETRLELPEGFDPSGPRKAVELDLTRIREDTGYVPEWDVERAIADYVAWLRKGNEF